MIIPNGLKARRIFAEYGKLIIALIKNPLNCPHNNLVKSRMFVNPKWQQSEKCSVFNKTSYLKISISGVFFVFLLRAAFLSMELEWQEIESIGLVCDSLSGKKTVGNLLCCFGLIRQPLKFSVPVFPTF